MKTGGAVRQESRRFIFQGQHNHMEEIMLEVSLVLNQNEVEMICSFLERAVLFEEDGEDTPEFRTNFRLLVRKFAFVRSFMKAKSKN